MTLHEIYNKLLRRGCPEHPRVRYSERPWYTGTHWGYHDEDDGKPLMSADAADARAIITMHALEWWLTTKLAMSVSTRSPHWGIGFPPCATTGLDGSVNHAPTILEAIEAATRYLEPKEKP